MNFYESIQYNNNSLGTNIVKKQIPNYRNYLLSLFFLRKSLDFNRIL